MQIRSLMPPGGAASVVGPAERDRLAMAMGELGKGDSGLAAGGVGDRPRQIRRHA